MYVMYCQVDIIRAVVVDKYNIFFSVLTVMVCCSAPSFELLDMYALIFYLINVIIPPFLLSPPSSSISSEALISSSLECPFVDEFLVYSIYQYALSSFCCFCIPLHYLQCRLR